MKHYIFSYGTLACKEVANKNGKTLDFIPAYLQGYVRNFCVQSKTHGLAGAGIEGKEGAKTLGMLVQVLKEELGKFDEREHLYTRIKIDGKFLNLASDEPLPEGGYYLYLPKNPEEPTEAIPVAQSYIDVILSAFLNIDPRLAAELARSMQGLNKPWINDRQAPRYPRPLANPDAEAIDRLLQEAIPDLLRKRKEAPVSFIKPELAEAILKTVRFFDLFDFPLTAQEILENLYKYPHPLHIKELKATLRHLADSGELAEIKDYFVLSGRESIAETRKTRTFIAEKLWNRVRLYSAYMRSVPFIQMIGVCNNLAYNNPGQESDIDLFIVVKPGRMWTARFFITIILHFFGVRRHGNKIAGRFCLSFFVTSNKMSMRPFALKDEDPYLAYWTKNLKPVFGEAVYRQFRSENKEWLKTYGLKFNDAYTKYLSPFKKSRFKKFLEWVFGGWLGDGFENLLKKTLKKKTLRSKQKLDSDSKVMVTDEVLKFHNDRRQEFFDRWLNM